MFFQGWEPVVRLIIAAVVGYIALIVSLRASGKRTLSKMNAFDLVITVTIGSTFASLMLNKNVAIVEGLLAFAMLAGLQFVTSWFSVRFDPFENLIKAQPTLLLYRGSYLKDVMLKVRITESEVRAALRKQGIGTMDVEAVVLETDGTLTVVPRTEVESAEALSDVVPKVEEVQKG